MEGKRFAPFEKRNGVAAPSAPFKSIHFSVLVRGRVASGLRCFAQNIVNLCGDTCDVCEPGTIARMSAQGEDELSRVRRATKLLLSQREVSPVASFFGTFSFLPVSGFGILLVALLFFATRPLPVVHAQVSSGSILGYVYDPSGALIANANVTISDANHAIIRKTITDSAGAFSLAELSPGVYSVTASSPGFGEITQSEIRVLVNTETRADFHLPIAGQKKTVEVTVLSPEAQPETSEVGTVIEQQQIDSIPLNRRNFLELALLAPGVAPPVQNSELSSFGAFSMNADGGREESNDFLLDGVDNNDPYVNRYGVEPPMESIQEFKVATNSYDAEYGRNSAAQVNVITRQGTNDFHGSTYDYLRNRVLDARNYFDPTDTAKLVRNQFGFSVGGPVVHNNTFFFASTDWFRDREGLSQESTVPTGDEAGGNLGGLCQTGFNSNGVCNPPPAGNPQNLSAVQIYDPTTGQPFQNNLIPSGEITSTSKDILKMFPGPNVAPAPGNLYGTFDSSPVQNENDAFGTYRVDHRIGASDSLDARYSFTTVDLFEPWGGSSNGLASANVGPGFGDYVKDQVQDGMLQYRHVLSSRAVNTVSASYGRFSRDVLPQNFNVNVGQLWDVTWLNEPATGYGFPSVSVAGLSGVGDNTTYPIYRHTNTYQIEDQLAIDRGAHQLKIGGEVRELQLNGALSLFTRGSLSFSGAVTGQGPASECSDTGVTCGNALADLLLGYPSFGLQSQAAVSINMRSQAYAAYVQDDWRISRNLTLNLGMRYEFMRPPISPNNQMYTLDSSETLVQVGTNGIPRSGVRSDHDNFAPRVGLAWNVGRSFVVRAGYGVYYDSGMFEVDSSMFFNPPEFDLLAYFGTTLGNPFQSGFAIPPQLAVVNPNATTPYVQQWNFSVERPLGSLGTLNLGYVGSKGTHLVETYDLNQPHPGGAAPYPNYGGIYYINTVADSNYNSFQATFNRPLGSHMSLWAAYTWSHSIDDQSAFSDTIADPNFPQNSYDLAAERANSSFDMRQRFVLTYVLRLPDGNRWTRNTEFHGITQVQSGEWFTPTLAFDNSETDNSAPGQEVGSDRPNLIGNPNSGTCSNGAPVRTANCWFNTSAFAVAPTGTFGDAGRNSLVGPGLATFDLSLMRRFSLSERLRLTAEAEAFNLFNRVNFELPQAVVPSGPPGVPIPVSPLFGEIPSANAARQVQIALRLTF